VLVVGTVVLLMQGARDELVFDSRAAGSLAALGVTHVTLVSDDTTAALVLEGWAFEPRQAHEAAAVLGAAGSPALTARVHMAVSAATNKGADNEETTGAAAGGDGVRAG
jgi:hypothetical protein